MHGAQSGVANGNIFPFTSIMWDTTPGKLNNFIQCTDGGEIAGISQEGTDSFPFSFGGGSLDSNFAATAGEEFKYYPLGVNWCLLLLGGTVNPGNRLKSGTWNGIPGTGVVSSAGSEEIGAIALAGGTAGDLVPVRMVGPGIGHT